MCCCVSRVGLAWPRIRQSNRYPVAVLASDVEWNTHATSRGRVNKDQTYGLVYATGPPDVC